MGASPLVHEGFGPDGGAGVPNVAQLGLVEADERDDEHIALEPEQDPDGDVGLVGMGDPPEPMSFRLPYPLVGRCLASRFAVELSEVLEQRQRDLFDGTASGFDGRQPSIEVLRPVHQHLRTITLDYYNQQVVLGAG